MGALRYESRQVHVGQDVACYFFIASCVCEGVVVKPFRMLETPQEAISRVAR